MKSVHCLIIAGLLSVSAGCAYRRPAVYAETPVFKQAPISSPAYRPPPVQQARIATQTDTDRDLALAVRNEFNRYGELAGLLPNIAIGAERGVVTLMGSVPDVRDSEMINALVKNTPGVASVNNLLRVTDPRPALQPTGRADERTTSPSDPGSFYNLHVQGLTETDRQLGHQILAGLRNDTALAAAVPKVDIYVAQGEVTLRGIVQTEEQSRAIESTVNQAVGAGKVRNELRVQRVPQN
jgi:osmotically-inducible protein OsmY